MILFFNYLETVTVHEFKMSIYLHFSTFVCPTEIIAFSDRVEEFRKINAEVVAVSVDSVFTHLAWYNFIPSLYLFYNYIIPFKILKPNNNIISMYK